MDPNDRVRKGWIPPPGLMDFTDDSNPLGPSGKAKNAVRKNIKLLGREPDKEPGRLAKFLCLREHIGINDILVGPDPARALRGLLVLTAAKTALVSCPLPENYRTILKRSGVRIVPFHLDGNKGFHFEAEKFIRKIKDADSVILQNPNMMTGTVHSSVELDSIIESARLWGKLLVIDESGIDYCGEPSPVKKITGAGNAVLLRTFSNFHALAGFRLGYVIGHRRFLQSVGKHLDYPPADPLAGAAAIASLRDRGYRKRTFSFMKDEKEFIKNALDTLGGVQCIDTQCNFLILRFGKEVSNLRESFLARRILIEDFADKNNFRYVRLPVKKHQWNARFIQALKKIGGT